jgi:hypothetical protein
MSQLIEFDGEVVEFPDGMSDAEIEAALNSLSAGQGSSQGGSIADALGQGAFFGFSDELAGVTGAAMNTLMNAFGKGTGESFGEAYTGIRDAARENAAAFAARNPGTALTAEIVGGLTTGGFGAARAGAFQAAKNAPTLVGKLRPVVQTGAVQGGLYGAGASEGDPEQVAKDTLRGATIGGATAPILPAIAGAGRSTANRIFNTQTGNRQFQRYAQKLEDEVGIRLTTGQKTGSEAVRSVESTVGGTLTGGRIARQIDENRRKFQGKLMRMAGFTRNDAVDGLVTADAINNATARFAKQYTKLLKGRTVSLDSDDFIDRIGDVQAKNLSMLPFEQKRQLTQIVDELFDDVTQGPVSATRYNEIRSNLGNLERSFASKPYIARLYRELKHAIDDEVADQLNLGLRKRVVDRQYNRFTKIRDTFESSASIDTARGDLPLAMLLRRAQKRGKGADAEFTDLVRAGQAVLGDPMPNSGTPTRLINAALLGGATFDPTGASAATILGLPFLGAQALSRGFTGSKAADKVIASGLLTAPALNPIFSPVE